MSYKGDISCTECFELLKGEPTAQIVDVRTVAEWNFVGIVDLSDIGKNTIYLEWQEFPNMQVNERFAELLEKEMNARGADKNASIAFLCRSGVRSQSAASVATSIGYANSYNISEGFEGEKDAQGQRGNLAGWKKDGLPWRQG